MTKHKNQRQVPGPSAEAFSNMAIEYHLAATSVFSLGSKAESPLYFLYAHAMELAIKAYLRSHRSAVPHIHDLSALLARCRLLGLSVSRDLKNVIELLGSENNVHGFRYFAGINTLKPERSFLREVADALIATIADEIGKNPEDDNQHAGCVTLVVGKPRKK